MHEPRSDWLSLAKAPREIPPSTRFALRFRTLLFTMANAAACIALPFLFVIARSEVVDWSHFRSELQVADGTVTHVEETSMSEGGGRSASNQRRIRRYDYEFDQEGRRLTGVSFSETARLVPGVACVVEFAPGEPERSRIRGMRSREFSLDSLFGLFVPAMALALLIGSQVQAARVLRLLESGRPETGRVIEMKAFGRKRRGRTRSFRATVEFSLAAGAAQRVKLVTQKEAVFRDERGVRLLYDADRPELARVFDDLPIKVTLDGRGRIAALPWSRVAHALWLPCATLAGCIVLVYALC